MFNTKKSSNSTKTRTVQNSGAINNITQGTAIEGTVQSDSDIRIDGTLKGNLNCRGKVIIGEHGMINGIVYCENAVIEGKLIGELHVNDALQVSATGVVDGQVNTAHLSISPGAQFNGTCHMGKDPEALQSGKQGQMDEELIEIEPIPVYSS